MVVSIFVVARLTLSAFTAGYFGLGQSNQSRWLPIRPLRCAPGFPALRCLAGLRGLRLAAQASISRLRLRRRALRPLQTPPLGLLRSRLVVSGLACGKYPCGRWWCLGWRVVSIRTVGDGAWGTGQACYGPCSGLGHCSSHWGLLKLLSRLSVSVHSSPCTDVRNRAFCKLRSPVLQACSSSGNTLRGNTLNIGCQNPPWRTMAGLSCSTARRSRSVTNA